MLAERPVVATDVGSTTDALRDGVTGLVVPVEDDGALASALVRLRDASLRRRLGEAGGVLARERFTAAAMARSYEAVYARVLRRT
jgi:glycosyltransferase involved in cell wall biosynthesis